MKHVIGFTFRIWGYPAYFPHVNTDMYFIGLDEVAKRFLFNFIGRPNLDTSVQK